MRNIKFVLVLFIIGMVIDSHCQVIYNGSFEEYYSTYDDNNPFTHGYCGPSGAEDSYCVPYWRASHGTPQINNGGYRGVNCAFLWAQNPPNNLSNKVVGEGIFTNVCFTTDASYFITLWVKLDGGTPLEKLYIYASSGVDGSQLKGGLGDPIPDFSSKALMYDGSVTSNSWTQIVINFNPVFNYNQIWIYPYQSSSSAAHIWIDDIEILKSTCCPDHKLYQNTKAFSAITSVASYIQAGKNIGYNVIGNASVLAGDNVVFRAGDYVSLDPGFEANYGSNFKAVIKPCTTALNCDYTTCQDNSSRRIGDNSSIGKALINIDTKDVKVYPNPTSGKLFVDLPTSKKLSIDIFDCVGIAWIKMEFTDMHYETKEIDLGKLPSGIYFIIINKDGKITKETITIQR